jgi:hypothetical protein
LNKSDAQGRIEKNIRVILINKLLMVIFVRELFFTVEKILLDVEKSENLEFQNQQKYGKKYTRSVLLK